MTLLLLSSIPLVILMFFGRRVSNSTRYWLSALSIPFFIILGFYALILAVALTISFMLIWQIQKWRFKKRHAGKHQPIEIIYNRRSDWEAK